MWEINSQLWEIKLQWLCLFYPEVLFVVFIYSEILWQILIWFGTIDIERLDTYLFCLPVICACMCAVAWISRTWLSTLGCVHTCQVWFD